jgi:hypothetical protein
MLRGFEVGACNRLYGQDLRRKTSRHFWRVFFLFDSNRPGW